jgi:hypothetical protein
MPASRDVDCFEMADEHFDKPGRSLDPDSQARIDKLAHKCNEGQLTDQERREYETYVQSIDFIAILQAKARALLKQPTDA